MEKGKSVKEIKKVVRVGTVEAGKRRASVFCKIEYQAGKLSISGVVGPLPSGNCLGSCGQIDMGMKPSDFQTLAPGWTYGKIKKFLKVWDSWHLNDLHAGTPKQEAVLKGLNGDYSQNCGVLKRAGL
jgi:hypothetical protein